MRTIFWLVCLLVVYGSLFPFDFSARTAPLSDFLMSWRGSTSRGDILGNIALYVPFGFFGYLAYQPRGGRGVKVVLLTIFGLLISIACQSAQMYLPSRSATLVDVYWNAFGLFIGMIVAAAPPAQRLVQRRSVLNISDASVMLLVLWVAYRLIPFVPTVDWQAYKDAFKPLVLSPALDVPELVTATTSWLVVAHVSASLLGPRWKWRYLPLAAVATMGLEIIIVNNSITLTDVCAAGAAALLWPLLAQFAARRSEILAWLMLAAIVADGIFPLMLRAQPTGFGWVPFAGFLEGSMLVNSSSLAKKLFLLGGALVLFRQAGYRAGVATILVVLVVTTVEVAQIWIAGRTPEVTDTLLVIALAWLISRTAIKAQAPPQIGRRQHGRTMRRPTPRQARNTQVNLPHFAGTPRWHVFVAGAALCSIIAGSAYVATRLSGIPYNVREMFRYGGTGVDLLLFGCALLWIGFGTAWMGRLTALKRRPFLTAPLMAVVVSVVLYALLRSAVTMESIADIAGSAVLTDRIGRKGVLGQVGIDLVAAIGPGVLHRASAPIERLVRFGALVGPLLIFLGISFAALWQMQPKGGPASLPTKVAEFSKRLLTYLLFMLPWLLLCKVIAFDWSSTDNINELIAREGSLGLGGGGWLYALVFLVSIVAALLAWLFASSGPRFKTVGAAVSLVSATVPIGWVLLNAGLVENFEKYGLRYSGVDFLLGPDRSNLLSTPELFTRWALLYIGAVSVLVGGALLYLALVRDLATKRYRWRDEPELAPSQAELHVHLHGHQLELVTEMSRTFDGSLSKTIGWMLDDLKAKTARDKVLRSLLISRIEAASRVPDQGLDLTRCRIQLTPEQMQFVSALAAMAGVSQSRVVRRATDLCLESGRSSA